MSGGKPENPGRERARCEDETEAEEVTDCLRLEAPIDQAAGENGLELGAEDESISDARIVQRLDAQPVPDQHQPAGVAIPQGDCKHAAQRVHAVDPPLLVQVEDHLDVGAGAKTMAPPLELGPQLRSVVDFPVADDRDGLVLVHDGLIPTDRIDDRQPADTQTDPRPDQQPLAVRSSVCQATGHPYEPSAQVRHFGNVAGHATDPTHLQPSVPTAGRRSARRASSRRSPVSVATSRPAEGGSGCPVLGG